MLNLPDARMLSELPAGAWVALGLLLVVQLSLQVAALVRVFRLPENRVRLGNRWIWVAVTLLVNTLGPIVTLIFVALPETPDEGDSAHPRTEGLVDVADMLYGAADEEANR